MERGVNVVLRILIIVLCFVLAVSAVYLFSVRYVNSFYKADANFLQGDDILSNPSVYVKMYGEDGRFIDVAGLSMERDFRLASSCSDGRVTVLLLVNNEGRAEIYAVSQEGKIDGCMLIFLRPDGDLEIDRRFILCENACQREPVFLGVACKVRG